MLLIETALSILAVLISFVQPSLGAGWFEKIEHGLSRLAKRRALAVGLVGIAALALRAAVLPVEPVPEPVVHDEFGYLLAADTFAHGRLTNPTHPMWMHFESFNILQRPTYQCITPPVQGMILAFGKVVFGHPFWGVWLSAGLMCAAITWMLQGWVPLEWALLGGALAILRYGVWTYWADSYWGGAAGAIGGALVLGALPRIKRDYRVHDTLILALGLALLANNRPYDGFIFSLPIMLALLAWILGKESPPLRVVMKRLLLPLGVVITITAIGTGYYFWRVTGNPFRMPYQIEREAYGVAPYLLWQHLRPEPAYRHEALRKMYVDEEMISYRTFRTPVGVGLKAYIVWRFFLGPLFTLPFVALLFTLPYGFSWSQISRTTIFLLITLGSVAIGVLSESFYVGAHYSSPVTGLILALIVIALCSIRASGPKGVFLTRSVVACAVIIFGLRAMAVPFHIPLGKSIVTGLYERTATDFGRGKVQRQLEQTSGKNLVIVHYGPDHEPFDEWVYNDAEIDQSKVVWAREMDAGENRRLLNYFKERQVWLLNADVTPLRLLPYPEQPETARIHAPANNSVPPEVK
jgi:hypothetical protein